MSQSGSTSFLRVSSVSSTPIFTDTFIDENSTAANHSTADPLLFSATSDQVKAIIFDITVPDRKDLVDSNGNKLPDDVIFSKADIRLRISGAPSSNSQVRGYILTTAASIPSVDWATQDGSTAWHPDQFGEVTGTGADTVYEKVVHGEIVINQNVASSTADDSYITLNLFNLRKKQTDVDFGKNFQIIVYASVASSWGVHSADHTVDTDHCPHLKIHFVKPAPDEAKITVTPDAFGHNGTVNIVSPTTDKNLQKYYVGYKVGSSGVAQSNNTTTISDIGTKSIALTDLTQGSTGSNPAYAYAWPNAVRTKTYFKLFSEDLYNTTTNATPSNEVDPRIRPNATNKFHSYNAAGTQDDTPAIGEEMTLRLSPIDVFGKVSEYAINFDVESSLIDTGITYNETVAGSSWTNTSSNVNYTKLYNSDPDAFTLGETLKITSAAGSEFVVVVGHYADGNYTVVLRGQLNTAAVSHTGLTDSTKIYKVNYDDFHFVKLPSLSPTLSVKHTFSKASADIHTNHVAIMIKDEYGWTSYPASLNYRDGSIVSESNPIAKLTASRNKVPYAKYGDQTAGLTLSLSNSSAVGSNREINHHAFSYNAFDSQTVATANALSNNNGCFETSSKRVQLIATGADTLTDSTWRIFGLVSVASDDSNLSDSNASFSHYKYDSEQITVGARITPVASNKYWKSIECVICEEIDADDDGNRFLLMVHPDDLTTHTASTLNEGDTINADLTINETGVTVADSSLYKAGDVVSIGPDPVELMLITSVDSSVAFTVKRKYLFTTNREYNDGVNLYIVENKDIKQLFVNKELRAKAKYSDSNFATKYMWGGFAQIIADDIDFSANNFLGLDGVTAASSFNDTDWYANGFAVGDVIKLKSNKEVNGTYAAPGYYKILDIQQSGGSGDYDLAYVAEHADMLSDKEATYVSTSFTTEDGRTADIVRYDNAHNPAITVAFYNYNTGSNTYAGNADTVKFEGAVIDDDTTSFIVNTNSDTLLVRTVGLSTLDLDALASNGDIAILNYNLGRSGGSSAVMPLGNRRYPIGGTNASLGTLTMSINVRILTQTGYREIFSLIEGDRYDYAFLDGTKIDSPSTAYKTYRMKPSGGQLTKDPEMASQYLATLTMLIMGEDVS